MDVEAAKKISIRGEELKQAGEFERAIACFRDAIELHPDHHDYYYQLGSILKERGHLVQASIYFRQAIALNSDNSWCYHSLGEILARQGKLEEAVECYRQAIKFKPNFSWSHYNLGRILHQKNQLEAAKLHYQQAIELAPEYSWSHYFLAEILTKQNQLEAGEKHYRLAIKFNPNFSDSYYQLARNLQQQTKLEAAVNYYRQSLKINPQDFDSYYHLGEILRQQNKFSEAITCYEQAIGLKARQMKCYLGLGKALIARGDDAIEAYRASILNSSDVERIYLEIGLAQAWEQQSQFTKTISCYQRAIEINPRFELTYRLLQYVRIEAPESIDNLINFYREISKQVPDFPVVWGNLGDMLTKQSRIAEAIDCYRTCCYYNIISHNRDFADFDWQARKQKGPDFIIIGAAKSGTTSLFSYLQEHPQILSPHKKEINFFNNHFDCGVEWYLAHFPAIADLEQFITGEASPYYSIESKVAERIAQLFPQVKLIVLLRNPVKRTISEYYHARNHGVEQRSLETIIEQEKNFLIDAPKEKLASQFGYLLNSIYVNKLVPWKAYFPKEKLLILESETFFSQTSVCMQQVFSFLGLPDYEGNSERIRHNIGDYSAVSPEIEQSLTEFFTPYNQQLEVYLERKFNW